MSDTVWKGVFWLAALFNFAAGLPMLLAPDFAVNTFALGPLPNNFLVQGVGSLIVTVGIGYAFVAMNLNLREIVMMGVVGKTAMVVLLFIYREAGQVSDAAFNTGMGDLAFTIAFVVFLLSRHRARLFG